MRRLRHSRVQITLYLLVVSAIKSVIEKTTTLLIATEMMLVKDLT